MFANTSPLHNPLSVTCDVPQRFEEAKRTSQHLHLPFNEPAPLQLCLTADKWTLQLEGAHPMWVDFEAAHWRKSATSKPEGLIRACKPAPGVSILDLTAGFGRDAALLLAKGASLTLVERDPIMQILLKDGVDRALQSGLATPATLRLWYGEAKDYLLQAPKTDVIYLDPMHPARDKSAKVKKEMQSLQSWIKPDEDLDELFALARQCAGRVVVKWPARLPPLAKPNHSLTGKTVRFDVYT